jgi:signal transduction histidine kinase
MRIVCQVLLYHIYACKVTQLSDMLKAPVPHNEKERLADLYQYDILDTNAETEFEELVLMASRICNAPVSLISLIDAERQWFKARLGMEATETPRDTAFCSHGILNGEIFIVPDATRDERFAGNPMVTGEQGIRFYAGVPLTSQAGNNLGMLCVKDTVPRNLNEEQQQALKILGKQVVKQLELRLKNKELERIAAVQKRIISIMAHDVRSPLSSIIGLFNLYENKGIDPQRLNDFLQIAGSQLNGTMSLLENLIEWGQIQLQPASLTTSPVNLKDEVQKVLNTLTVQANLKGDQLINLVPADVQVSIDNHVLQFILRNLVTNSIKFTSAGAISIEAITELNKVRMRITDTGIGMPPKMQERLFLNKEKHSRRGTQNEAGSGLGLVLIKEFIEKAGGVIAVESEEGRGTTFILDLPTP